MMSASRTIFLFLALIILGVHAIRPIMAMSANGRVGSYLSKSSKESEKSTTFETELVAAAKVKSAPLVVIPEPSKLRLAIATLGPVLASAFSAAAIMYPLDLIRALQMANAGSGVQLTTVQLLSNFRKAHGIKGFFTQGLAPELARATWMRFIKFSLFPLTHFALTGISEKDGSAWTRALASIIGSVPEVISIMPLELAKISLQLDTANKFKNNMFAAMSSIYKERGLQGFTIGYGGTQYRNAAWTTGYFVSIKFFEQKVEALIKAAKGKEFDVRKNPNVQIFSQLLSGFLAGVFGAALNTPSDTIRSTIQKRVLSGYPGDASFFGIANEIIKARGYGGLYAGFNFKAVHLGGGGALMAVFLPFFKKALAVPAPAAAHAIATTSAAAGKKK